MYKIIKRNSSVIILTFFACWILLLKSAFSNWDQFDGDDIGSAVKRYQDHFRGGLRLFPRDGHAAHYHDDEEQESSVEYELPEEYRRMRFTRNDSIINHSEQNKTTLNKCASKRWMSAQALPPAAVVIVFCDNERLEDVLHTVHSLVDAGPAYLLQQIILVADNVSKPELVRTLPAYVKREFGELVQLVYSSRPLGLIEGRLVGIRHATAPIVVVQDAHIEAQPGWLVPLVEAIWKNPRIVASVMVDTMEQISDGRWKFNIFKSQRTTAYFWRLGFRQFALGEAEEQRRLAKDPTAPIQSAATIGTWAIGRAFFKEIGELDAGMRFWGGENIDLAIRAYLWGGGVYNVPCSRVSHLERQGQRDYRKGHGNQTRVNWRRLADVWFDDASGLRETFFYYNPDLRDFSPGNLTERLALKARCPGDLRKDYLDKAFPQLGLPMDPSNLAWGGVWCTARADYTVYAKEPWLYGLKKKGRVFFAQHEEVFLTSEGHLRAQVTSFDIGKDGNKVNFNYYFDAGVNRTQWLHRQDGVLQARGSGRCLTCEAKSDMLWAEPCRPGDAFQQWTFRNYTERFRRLQQQAAGAGGGEDVGTDYLRDLLTFLR